MQGFVKINWVFLGGEPVVTFEYSRGQKEMVLKALGAAVNAMASVKEDGNDAPRVSDVKAIAVAG